MNIVFFNNNLSGMIYFRLEVMRHFLEKGEMVSVIAPDGENESLVKRLPHGVEYIPVKMNRTSTNPLKDFVLLVRVLNVLRKKKPCYLFNYTIKPNVYGALAAKQLGIRCTDMIAGLGYTFTNNSPSSLIARSLYKIAGRCAEKIVVLNQSNYDAVLTKGICKKTKLHLLKGGEGVGLNRYPFCPNAGDVSKFVFIGRLIEEKGYCEFVRAAEKILKQCENVEFHVVGGFDLGYPRCVTKEQVENDVANAGIVYHGNVDDMSAIYCQTGIVVVIPSYYSEGLNRSLMEGCASGKPIITTDWPGCRETVMDGENGYLVEPGNVDSLVKAIKRYLALSSADKERFSRASRQLAERNFNVEDVVNYYENIVSRHIMGGGKV